MTAPANAPRAIAIWIDSIERIVSDIGIEVVAALVADRVGLQEPPPFGRIHPRAVIIEAVGLGVDAPAGIAVRARRRGALPEHAIAGLRERARRGGEGRDHRALDIGDQGLAVARKLDLVQRVVDVGMRSDLVSWPI